MTQKRRKAKRRPGMLVHTHHKPGREKRQAAHRARDPRIAQAKQEARLAQELLEARMAYEAAIEPASVQVPARDAERPAKSAAEAAAVFRAAEEAARKRELWTLAEARNLVREGYSVQHTVERTGWPARDLEDVVAGQW